MIGVIPKPDSTKRTRRKHAAAIEAQVALTCLVCKRPFLPRLRYKAGFEYGALCCSMTCMEMHRQRIRK